MDDEGKGIVTIKGKEIHVPNLIAGETATIEVMKPYDEDMGCGLFL